MTKVSLIGCTECTSLPPLGQLPELKHLLVLGMPKVRSVGVEFYGRGSNRIAPFQKLETLSIINMPEWEKWSTMCDNEVRINFPNLHKLTMLKCQNLTDISPISCSVLHDLDIGECSLVLLESFCDLDSLTSLKVKSITGPKSLLTGLMNPLSTLEALECRNCNDLQFLWSNGVVQNLISLRRLVIADCSQLLSLGEGEDKIPSNLEVFKLLRCAKLTYLPNDLSRIWSLRDLVIHSCNSLESLPSITSQIERLEINDCPSLREWYIYTFEFPEALKKLSIRNCLNSDGLLYQLLDFSNLLELYISDYDFIGYQDLPRNLRLLSIKDCKNVNFFLFKIRTMESMRSLEIGSSPSLEYFPNFDFPPNLTSLRISDSKKFKPLSEWGLHRLTSLSEFSICGGFSDLELLGDDDCVFPPSLTKFKIEGFPKLASLSKVLENLVLLRHLSIVNCAKLNELPSEQLLEKLWRLEISDCSLLSQRGVKDKGDYWRKIAGIPCVEVDGTSVYRQRAN